MKTLILYKSKNGSTKEYVEFLHSRIKFSEIYDINKFNTNSLKDFDYVVIGSATYMGQITAKDFLVKNWNMLKAKKVYFFSVDMMEATSEQSKISYETIPEDIRKEIKYIKLPGKLQPDRLNILQKIMVKAVKNSKAPLVDKMDFSKISPILNFITN